MNSGSTSPANLRPFHFMVAFWGERYRDYFADLFLPTLLAPNNLPLLKVADGHRFYIGTPRKEWETIKDLPIMQRLREYAAPVWVEVASPPDTSHIQDEHRRYEAVLHHMKRCQRRVLEEAYNPRAYGSFHFPDTLISDGMVALMLRFAATGKQLVISPALRQSEEETLADLERLGLWSPKLRSSTKSNELCIPPRLAAKLAVDHLHPEMEVFVEGAQSQPPLPPFRIWRVPQERGLLLHTFFIIPVLMDYSIVHPDHTACLDHDMIENVYVSTNFSNCGAVHVVRDSDEFMMLSITPKTTDHAVRMPGKQRSFVRREFERLLDIRRSYQFYVLRKGDSIRRELFRLPARWHAQDLDAVWMKEERRVSRLLNRALGDHYKQSFADDGRQWKNPSFNWRTLLLDFPPVLRAFTFRVLLQIRELGRGLAGVKRTSVP